MPFVFSTLLLKTFNRRVKVVGNVGDDANSASRLTRRKHRREAGERGVILNDDKLLALPHSFQKPWRSKNACSTVT